MICSANQWTGFYITAAVMKDLKYTGDFNPFHIHFYTYWKCQQNSGFPTFSRGIEIEHWHDIVGNKVMGEF